VVCMLHFRQITGIPTVFITMTANPNHPSMLADPDLRKKGSLNMDVVIRVFKGQIEELRKDLRERKILGNVINMISVTEFQKRGLPHIHMVVTLDHKVCVLNALKNM
jgi:Helitron helicase-like domain at N-terminus